MGKTAILFSGQGAQYSGMMKDLYDGNDACRTVFDLADKSLGRGIKELCFSGAQEKLNLTHNTQPCVLTADVAAYKAVESIGIKPDVVAGFSLGEYGALVAAGVFSFEDAIRLIQIRADAMQEVVPVGKGAMAAIKSSDKEAVKSLCIQCKAYVEPANYNSPKEIVISGTVEGVDEFMEMASEQKIMAMKIPVSAPFHCKLMEPAAEKLKVALAEVEMHDAEVPVFLNVDANPETDAERIREMLVLQAKSPVYWEQTILNMAEAGVEHFIEVGPGKTLTKFVKKTIKGADAVNIDTLEALKEL